MQRPHFHPARCRVCGFEGSRDEISQQGFCERHGEERFRANIAQLRAASGPFYEHWVRRSHMATRRRVVALEQREA